MGIANVRPAADAKRDEPLALDVVLAVGDRVSRVVEPEDSDYYPPRVSRRSEPPARPTP